MAQQAPGPRATAWAGRGLAVDAVTLCDAQDALGFLSAAAHVREDWVRYGMALKAEFGDSAYEAWESWSAGYPKFKQSEARATWRSFRKGGLGIGTLLKDAMAAGWQPRKTEYTAEEKARYARERAERMRVVEAQAQADAEHVAAWEAAVATAAWQIWQRCKPVGRSDYLGRKKVGGFGVGFLSEPVLAVYQGDFKIELLCGDEIKKGFAERGEKSVRFFKPGEVIVPVCDAATLQICNLQSINKLGKKLFLKHGRKSGCIHLIGGWPEPGQPVAVAEGYATAASVHMAKGWPVIVAFDCGNLPVIAAALRERLRGCTVFWCADDDAGGEGLGKAAEASAILPGPVVLPKFSKTDN